ncbi:NUDIX hydrolase [Flexivirga caeni]|uniref:NUDIX hydrolase n=1 Tax=Flexivirga caeni TaxID=2294115 RepID=UPI001315AC65|nr:NUDIX hydrolase [Flexivirga caeni]
MRECEEETGLTPTLGAILGTHSNTYVSRDGIERHGIRILYAAGLPDDAPKPTSPDDDEIDAVGWFPVDALPPATTEWATLGAALGSRTTTGIIEAAHPPTDPVAH